MSGTAKSLSGFSAACAEPPCSRSDLSATLQESCDAIGASHYLLAERLSGRSQPAIRIITANWIYDAIAELGLDAIAQIADCAFVRAYGESPTAFTPALVDTLSLEEARTIRRYGHCELYCFRLDLVGRRFFLLFSSPQLDLIEKPLLGAGLMDCRYAIAAYMRTAGNPAEHYSLTERERECLLWVSEGKTASEIAVILGVSGNTVNSYITQVIRKFRSSNRAMAIATAIRGGII